MLEPGVRYLPHPGPAALNLDAAVDLSKKSSVGYVDSREEEEEGGSDSDTPLDMSVTATARLSPVFPGFARQSSPSPARSDRSETSVLVRLPNLYSPGSLPRDWSAERSEADRDEFPRDGCHMCGMPRAEMAQHGHGEGVCNQRPIACPLCAKTFTLWSHYETHKKCHQKLKQRQYPCQSCGKIFTSASNRNMHQRIHKGVRPFQCIPCGVFFRQKAHLQKHQRTQGHIQATELYEKRKAEGLISGEEGKKEELVSGGSSGSSPRSEDSRQGGDSSSGPEEETGRMEVVSSAGTSPQHKTSPMQFSPPAGNEGNEVQLSRDQQICMNIEYNNITHGYECRQCDFGTHDHAMMKEHVATDHLREKADLQCKECMVTFTKPFNLKIHIRKHETSSQFLPCEYCEQVFKVPNKLIKHMEGVHSVCPTCGEKNADKAGLLEHLEMAHGEPRRTPSALGHLGGMAKPRGVSPHNEMDNRHAKMRKLDSLADHIRAKQLQAATVGTNHINGNTDKPGHALALDRRRKSEMPGMPGARQGPLTPLFRPGLEHLVTQLNKMHDKMNGQPMIKSENNNILSSLSKMSEFPQHWRPHSLERATPPHHQIRPADLTPPVSPPPTEHSASGPVLINNNQEPSDEEPEYCSDEKGLDLTVKREPKVEEEGDQPPARPPTGDREEAYRPGQVTTSQPILPHSFPYMVPNLPFLSRMPLAPIPHHNASFTEHLFKLASISRPPSMPPPSAPQDLSKPPSHPGTVLSAMLGHHRPPGPPGAQAPVFPGFPSGLQPLPASMFPQHPLPPGLPRDTSRDRSASPQHRLESKPFRCTFCPKEFGHLSSLESHVERLHTNESKHHCESCGKAFSSKSNLTAHKKIHSGERPFQCVVCQKRFRQKAHLQKHETTHSSATPYQCPHCDKAFGHPSNLNTHISTHSDVRPYECSDCGKAYKDAASFKRHRLVHTGERPHPCDLCPEQFIDSKSLRRHREIAHPTALPVPIVEEEEYDEDDDFVDPGQEEEYQPDTENIPIEEGEEDSSEEGGLEIVTEGPDDSGVSSTGTGLNSSGNGLNSSSLGINSSGLGINSSLDLTV